MASGDVTIGSKRRVNPATRDNRCRESAGVPHCGRLTPADLQGAESMRRFLPLDGGVASIVAPSLDRTARFVRFAPTLPQPLSC